MSVTIRKSRPLFREELKDAPGCPLGDRVLVREFPVESETEGGLHIAETAKEHYFGGTIVAAGDQAADKLYDKGAEIGDEVWYAKYAGVIQRWQHIVSPPLPEFDPKCPHDSAWEFVPRDSAAWELAGLTPNENVELRSCRACGAVKMSERVIMMTTDDLHFNVDLQVRLERGEYRRVQVDTDKGPQFQIQRPKGYVNTFVIVKESPWEF